MGPAVEEKGKARPQRLKYTRQAAANAMAHITSEYCQQNRKLVLACDMDETLLTETYPDETITLRPKILPMLRALRQKFELCLVTYSTRERAIKILATKLDPSGRLFGQRVLCREDILPKFASKLEAFLARMPKEKCEKAKAGEFTVTFRRPNKSGIRSRSEKRSKSNGSVEGRRKFYGSASAGAKRPAIWQYIVALDDLPSTWGNNVICLPIRPFHSATVTAGRNSPSGSGTSVAKLNKSKSMQREAVYVLNLWSFLQRLHSMIFAPYNSFDFAISPLATKPKDINLDVRNIETTTTPGLSSLRSSPACATPSPQPEHIGGENVPGKAPNAASLGPISAELANFGGTPSGSSVVAQQQAEQETRQPSAVVTQSPVPAARTMASNRAAAAIGLVTERQNFCETPTSVAAAAKTSAPVPKVSSLGLEDYLNLRSEWSRSARTTWCSTPTKLLSIPVNVAPGYIQHSAGAGGNILQNSSGAMIEPMLCGHSVLGPQQSCLYQQQLPQPQQSSSRSYSSMSSLLNGSSMFQQALYQHNGDPKVPRISVATFMTAVRRRMTPWSRFKQACNEEPTKLLKYFVEPARKRRRRRRSGDNKSDTMNKFAPTDEDSDSFDSSAKYSHEDLPPRPLTEAAVGDETSEPHHAHEINKEGYRTEAFDTGVLDTTATARCDEPSARCSTPFGETQ